MEFGYFKIVTGEELIALCKKTEDGWYIEDPAVLVHLKDYKLGLANWLPYTKVHQGRILPKTAVVFATDVADDMIEYYTKWRDPENHLDESEVKKSNTTLA